MKKLILFFAAVFITAISANVFAQGTGILPSVGSTHEYYVNSTDGTSQDLGDVNNTFVWWVSTNPADLTDQETPGTDFNVIRGDYGGVGSVNNYIIELEWLVASAEDTFYVVVQEFDTDGNQCSNTKAIAVVPQNDFQVQFVALEADGSTIGDSLSRCAPDVALTASGLDITYDYGVDTVQFKLSASGIYEDWSFLPLITISSTNISSNSEWKVGAGAWGVFPGDIPANPTGSEDVYLRVSLDYGDSGGTFEEVTTEQTISLQISAVQSNSNVPATVVDSKDVEFPTDKTQLHTIQARPATTGISFN